MPISPIFPAGSVTRVAGNLPATGLAVPQSAAVVFQLVGHIVTMTGSLFFGASDGTAQFTLTGVPLQFQCGGGLIFVGPSQLITVFSGVGQVVGAFELAADVLSFYAGVAAGGDLPVAPGGFAAVGDKGYPSICISWPIDYTV